MSDLIRTALERLVEALEDYEPIWGGFPESALAAARTALAQPTPPAEGEVGDEARRLAKELRDQADDMSPSLELFGLMHRAADLLEQRHPEPVPISERLPGPEDCDGDRRCWLFSKVEKEWRLLDVGNPGVPHLKYCFSHSLPATALPLPQQETPND